MQSRTMQVLGLLVMISLLISPFSIAEARTQSRHDPLGCPPVDLAMLSDRALFDSVPPECLKELKPARETIASDRTGNRPAAVGTLSTGGPDEFGYTYDDTVTYSWVPAATNTGLSGDDEFAGPFSIGFTFPFYGLNQTELYLSTNGLLTFGEGSYESWSEPTPTPAEPNNLIAPFWDDLGVGEPYFAGAVYYTSGGSAPNRYFIAEWRGVESYGELGTPFSFEVILYENGDILIQHQSLPALTYLAVIGIEDSLGLDGLEYGSDPTALDAIRFYYPQAQARVSVSPRYAGQFAHEGGQNEFTLTITNIGGLGADTYDLQMTSGWPAMLYEADGVTPLTSTDGDAIPDTGSLAQGSSVDVVVHFSAPDALEPADENTAILSATSSLDVTVFKDAELSLAAPAGFAGAFMDVDDGAMRLMTASPQGTDEYQVTPGYYFGNAPAIARMGSGSYLYAWTYSYRNAGGYAGTEIEYSIVAPDGSIILSPVVLSSHAYDQQYIYDASPSVAVAPDGKMGVLWYRYLYDMETYEYNYNIYFAILSSTGSLLSGPTNLTNNTLWGTYSTLNVPQFSYPTLAATSDNRFILAWQRRDHPSVSTWNYNVWHAVRSSAGAQILAPTMLTADDGSWMPVLNTVSGGRAILTWRARYGMMDYAVINSNGTLAKPITSTGSDGYNGYSDAVELPNGKIAVAWDDYQGVSYLILNSSYTVESGPTYLYSPGSESGYDLSITTDADSQVILSWLDDSEQHLVYALGDSQGASLVPPMNYRYSNQWLTTSWRGQSIERYDPPMNPFENWAGSVAITSDRSVVAVGRPHVGPEITSYTGASTGSLTAYVPMLFKNTWGSYNAALYVQNINAIHPASITIKFYDSTGNLTCELPDTVAPLASKGYWIPSQSCLPDGWVGGAVITSDYPIVTVGRPHVGTQVMTYNGFSSGALSAYLPMLFKHAWGAYDAAFYVQNVDSNPAHTASISIKYYDSDGNLTCEVPDTVAPLASKGYWVPSQSCLPVGWVGGAVVTSDYPIVTIGRPHVGAEVTSYSGFSGGSESMYVPMLFKGAFGGSYNSAFYVQNVDPSHTAGITIKYYDSNGNLTCEAGDTVSALASKGYWVPGESCLPTGWVGGAVVTSNYPIVAVGRPHVGTQVTTYPGIAGGSTNLYLPMLFKNMWGSYNSAFYVQNTDTLNPANVTLKFYDMQGHLSCTRSDSIPAKATLGYWVPSVSCDP